MNIIIGKRKKRWFATFLNTENADSNVEDDRVFADNFGELLKAIGEKDWINTINKQ